MTEYRVWGDGCRAIRPTVLLDVDGVLADFVTPTLRVIEEITGVTPSYPLEWDFFAPLAKDVRRATFERLHAPGFCEGLPVYEGAIEGVARLRQVADVHIVTPPMPSPTWMWERQVWLRRHFGIEAKDVTHTSHKAIVRGDILIDDKPSNVEEWAASARAEDVAVLFDRPYSHGRWHTMAADWEAVLGIVAAWQVRRKIRVTK